MPADLEVLSGGAKIAAGRVKGGKVAEVATDLEAGGRSSVCGMGRRLSKAKKGSKNYRKCVHSSPGGTKHYGASRHASPLRSLRGRRALAARHRANVRYHAKRREGGFMFGGGDAELEKSSVFA